VPKRASLKKVSTASAVSSTSLTIGTIMLMQVHSAPFADGQLSLPDPPHQLTKKRHMQRAHALQDLFGVRQGRSREDSVLLKREKHGSGEILLNRRQLRGDRQPAQRNLLRPQNANFFHQVKGMNDSFSNSSTIFSLFISKMHS
jgi:hypothetical protein